MTILRALALAAVLGAAARAQDAKLSAARGGVEFKPAGAAAWTAASGGEELLFGDSVRVAKGGVAHLVFPDRGAALLRDETEMTLQGSATKTTLSVRFGEFLVGLRRRLAKGESFRVRTPAAVASVRGTLFWGKSDKDDKSSTYAGFGHEIAVTAKNRTVVVKPGRSVTVPFGLPPPDPRQSEVTLETAKTFAVDGGIEGLETLAEGYQPPKTEER